MTTIDVPGARLDATIEGEGPAVIALHGLTSSRASDRAIGFDWTSALRATHRVVTYDARGHGRSTGRPEPDDWQWSALAGDLLAVADAVSPAEPVAAIGASMGCATILHAAVRAPQRFGRLVLVIPPTAWSTRAEQTAAYEQGARLLEQYGAERFRAMQPQEESPPALGDNGFPDPDLDEQLWPSILRGAGRSDLPEPHALAGLPQPTLILAWVGDPGHPLSTAERLADLIPDAHLKLASDPDDLAAWPGLAADFLR
ncbi:alpha/beta hydrolase [Calidifontibacter sp. DB0510]|uniref:Alpha/beta hydrolase n=1 Tax=Metallococcus carri TaxID=1656884 RepID=A0A967B4K0_9MICO|nr:alpha/beta fold hydrolase [Metallococcus carri]NHN57160.1 alpha/beta hydrolase [Metallococcus carri]NOP38037.1 alpha/beta fold hydrolase [Calidifontibacter sp. DB2511S]